MRIENVTSPEHEAFFAAVGRFTISWARLKSGIDLSVLIIHRSLGGKEFEHTVPRTLDRKLGFLRKTANKIGQLAPWQTSTLNLVNNVKTASEVRRDIIHDIVVQHDLPKSVEMKMIRLLRGASPVPQKKFPITTHFVLAEAAKTSKLAHDALDLSQELVELAAQPKVHQRASRASSSTIPVIAKCG